MTWELHLSDETVIEYRYEGEENASVGAYRSNKDDGTWYLLTHKDGESQAPHDYPIRHYDYMSRAEAIRELNSFVSTKEGTAILMHGEEEV